MESGAGERESAEAGLGRGRGRERERESFRSAPAKGALPPGSSGCNRPSMLVGTPGQRRL